MNTISKPATADESASSPSSYSQVLRSTALIGGSSVVTVLCAIVRNKAIASLLGPEGIGLMALYGAIVELGQTLASFGLQPAGVRQIAEAVGAGDPERIARTATVVRRVSIVLAILGAGALAASASEVAVFTFGDAAHAGGVALLSLALLFQVIFLGQTALLQGLRRIGDLTRVNVLTAVFSTAISVPMVYAFGAEGIAPALIAVTATGFVAAWWRCRTLGVKAPAISLPQLSRETSALLELGLVFMASALLTVGGAYAVRLIVLREAGVEAAGLYQSAWALGGLYVGFILQAMGTDFYPRLTAVAEDDAACNGMVNEQAQVSMLLAGPGVIATLTAAPFVIHLFYTAEFLPAVEVLRAVCLGMMLRVVAWPMGFIVLAKSARAMFFWTEVAATMVHVGLAAALIGPLGVAGAGLAFLGLYVWHGLLIYLVARRLSGFRWSSANMRLMLLFLPAAGLAFAASRLLPFWPATAVGAAVTVLCGLYSLRMLLRLTPVIATRFAMLARLQMIVRGRGRSASV